MSDEPRDRVSAPYGHARSRNSQWKDSQIPHPETAFPARKECTGTRGGGISWRFHMRLSDPMVACPPRAFLHLVTLYSDISLLLYCDVTLTSWPQSPPRQKLSNTRPERVSPWLLHKSTEPLLYPLLEFRRVLVLERHIERAHHLYPLANHLFVPKR